MKRIIVFSDTHGNRREMRDALCRFAGVELVLHLGDGVAQGESVAREFGIPFLGVAGNEDVGEDVPRERAIDIGNLRLLAVHGDRFDIGLYDNRQKWDDNLGKMAGFAALQGARVLLFGHSHAAMLVERGGVVLCNPGDQYPGSQAGASFCMLEASGDALRIALFRKETGEWKESSSLNIST